MKSMIRCPSCGRRRKPGHEKRASKENRKKGDKGLPVYSELGLDEEKNITSWPCVSLKDQPEQNRERETERVAVIAKKDARIAEALAKALADAVRADEEAVKKALAVTGEVGITFPDTPKA